MRLFVEDQTPRNRSTKLGTYMKLPARQHDEPGRELGAAGVGAGVGGGVHGVGGWHGA